MSDKLAKLTLKRNIFINQITETFIYGRALPTNPSDPMQNQIFAERANDVSQIYDDFKAAHNSIIGLVEEVDFDAQDAIRKKVDSEYYQIKALLHNLSDLPTSTISSPITETPKLNKLQLPTFDGNYKEWHTFFDLYKTMVHENTSLSPIAKYQYLLTSLKGEAFNLLKGFPVTNDNYEIAYNALKGRYQNKRHLATLYFHEILNLKPIKEESSKIFRTLIDTFKENTEGFRMLGFPVDDWDFLLFNLLLLKLDTQTKTTFESEHTSFEIPTYPQLMDFLEKRAKALDSVVLTSNEKPFMNRIKNNPREKVTNLKLETNSISPKCLLCKESHPIYRCATFNAKSSAERLSIAREHNLCRNCLSSKHTTQNCASSHRCRMCQQHHHTSLHFDTKKPSSVHVGTSWNIKQPLNQNEHQRVILPLAFVKIKDRFGQSHFVRALIDSGSMSNFITDKLSKKLRLPRSYHSSLEIRGLNSMTSICNKGSVQCHVQPIQHSEPSLDFKALITPSICSHQPSVQSIIKAYPHLKHLNFTPEPDCNSMEVDLLLGAELVPQVFLSGRIQNKPNDPVALESIFGWILIGKSSISSTTSTCLSTTDAFLDESLPRFWELESIPRSSTLTLEENQCENHFKQNYVRTEAGRFIVSLPFKNQEPILGSSYQSTLKRFTSLENRLLKNLSLKNDYVNFMKDYLDSGHMSLIANPEVSSKSVYYIPHHCVLRPESASTKLRVVFDASSVTSNGHSLNDALLIGPKLQQDIVKILLKFRCFPFAFTCDIKQMYRQILISPKDRDFQRILWRFSPDESIKEYVLNTVTYGVSSAPFLALRTLIELAHLYKHEFPLASKAVQNNVYIDDIVTGAASIEEACQLQQESIDLLKKGGFELRKWASNCSNILQSVSKDDLQHPVSMDYDEISYIKVLGLQWDPATDHFSYSHTSRNTPCTKRSILSDIARIYDPLGFLTPCTLKAKRFIQQLWQLKSGWDETPPNNIVQNWQKFKDNLKFLSNLRLPRLTIPLKTQSIQLHLFCDASQVGYCTVAYLRCQKSDLSITTTFLCAKSRVAPLKSTSIPRLELLAAVLLVNLLENLKEILSPQINFDSITAWSDSQVTLAWIASLSSRWKIFVANRVNYIQEILPSSSWRYVPSLENPADCGSRGLFPETLIPLQLWWEGPSWLRCPPKNWPAHRRINPEIKEIHNEQRVLQVNSTEVQTHILSTLLNKFSSINKIKRILAYMYRFILHCQKQKRYYSLVLSPFEIQNSLHILIRFIQNQHFATLFTAIKENKPLLKPYRQLAPFVDRDKLLRVGGRLKNATLPFDHKHPVLLPKTSRLSELIVQDIHQTYLHPGPRTLQSIVLQHFWIISSRQVIQRVISKCIRCFRCKPRSYAPFMADLPSCRVADVRAFSTVSVDFAGPIYTTLNRTRGSRSVKSYFCVFVCTSTKAIHLELVTDLTTEAFIAALRRFIARRGRCSLILSDQGTNFVGANNKLKEMAEASGTRLGLHWIFHPPGGPHFNGLAEAGVKSVKSHLLRVIGDQRLTFEEVYTVLTQIEAVLNSRPLTPISSDPNDLQPLTPGHFLCLEPLNSLISEPDYTKVPLNRLDRWKLLQRMLQDFWKRWTMEYLSTLQARSKWTSPTPIPTVGDLVIVKNEQLPPLKWEMGRITQLHPGDDGVIRVVTIRTKNGLFTRPTIKICPLPANETKVPKP
ncbi:uncharacterized protein [Onthophagus taurus]|uniref:uncharacterized protein n=1 Tax=Onthophagus taurus TaxID=166361 RepID=UPI0039BDCD67